MATDDRSLVEKLREESHNLESIDDEPTIRLLREAAVSLEGANALQHETDMLLGERTQQLSEILEASRLGNLNWSVITAESGAHSADAEMRADGERWDTYARRLERRIKEQKDALRNLQAVREPGDKVARRKIQRLESALGRMTERWEFERKQKHDLLARPERSEGAQTSPAVAAVDAHVATVREALEVELRRKPPHAPWDNRASRALVALDALVAALREAQQERDETQEISQGRGRDLVRAHARIADLRADNARLRAALQEIAEYVEAEWREGEKAYQVAIVARDALAGSAGSPPPPEPEAQSAKSADVRGGETP